MEIIPYKLAPLAIKNRVYYCLDINQFYKQKKIIDILECEMIFYRSVTLVANTSFQTLSYLTDKICRFQYLYCRREFKMIYSNIGNIIYKCVNRYIKRRYVRFLKSLLPSDVLLYISKYL